jgi:hypothetical protein
MMHTMPKEPSADRQVPVHKARVIFRLAIMLLPFVLALAGGLYACSAPSRAAAQRFFAAVRESGAAPYALDPVDPDDAAAALREVRRSTGFSVWNFHQVSQSGWTRSCLFGRLSFPEEGRWIDVALEKRDGEWRVRDISFVRDCSTADSSDLRLH